MKVDLIIQSVDFLCNTGVPRLISRIYQNLTFDAFHSGVRCTVSTLCQNRVYVLNRWSNIQEAVTFLYCLEMTPKKNVIHQQLDSMNNLSYVGENKIKLKQLYVSLSSLHFLEQHTIV